MKPLGWECLGGLLENHKAVSKIKLNPGKAVLSPALVKLQAGSREHLCPPSCAGAAAALGSQGISPSPAVSAGWGAAAAGSKTGLRWLLLPPISRNRQERSGKGWGQRARESGGCDNG